MSQKLDTMTQNTIRLLQDNLNASYNGEAVLVKVGENFHIQVSDNLVKDAESPTTDLQDFGSATRGVRPTFSIYADLPADTAIREYSKQLNTLNTLNAGRKMVSGTPSTIGDDIRDDKAENLISKNPNFINKLKLPSKEQVSERLKDYQTNKMAAEVEQTSPLSPNKIVKTKNGFMSKVKIDTMVLEEYNKRVGLAGSDKVDIDDVRMEIETKLGISGMTNQNNITLE